MKSEFTSEQQENLKLGLYLLSQSLARLAAAGGAADLSTPSEAGDGQDPWIVHADAWPYVGISDRTLRQHRKDGDVHGERYGRTYRYRKSELDRLKKLRGM